MVCPVFLTESVWPGAHFKSTREYSRKNTRREDVNWLGWARLVATGEAD